MCVCVCVCVCVFVYSLHAYRPKADKGVSSSFIVDPLPFLGIMVCEGVKPRAIGCGGLGGALVWRVWLLGLRSVEVWFSGMLVKKPPPPLGQPPPRKNPHHPHRVVICGVPSLWYPPPEPPRAPIIRPQKAQMVRHQRYACPFGVCHCVLCLFLHI